MLIKVLQITYWVGMITTLIMFYYSLRTDTEGLKYTIFALIIWGITYGVHFLKKKIEKKEFRRKSKEIK
jgi:hypothetical protein